MVTVVEKTRTLSLYQEFLESVRDLKASSKKQKADFFNCCKKLFVYIDYALDHDEKNSTALAIAKKLAPKTAYDETQVYQMYYIGSFLMKYTINLTSAMTSSIQWIAIRTKTEFFKKYKTTIINAINGGAGSAHLESIRDKAGLTPDGRNSKQGMTSVLKKMRQAFSQFLAYRRANGLSTKNLSLYLYDNKDESVIEEISN